MGNEPVFTLNWADDRIYFIRRNGGLARCKPDGSELETVAPAAASVLMYGDSLFVRPDFEAKIFQRTNLNGTNVRELRF